MHMQLSILLLACALDGGLYATLIHCGELLIYGCDGSFSISMHADHGFRAGKENFSSPFQERFKPFRSSLQIFVKKKNHGD
jgi:hypothetical protein